MAEVNVYLVGESGRIAQRAAVRAETAAENAINAEADVTDAKDAALTEIDTAKGTAVSDVGTAKDDALAEIAVQVGLAEGYAQDAADAAATILPLAPSYANLGGTGDRTSLITVSVTSGLIGAGSATNLVDGGTGTNTTDSLTFAAVAVSGKEMIFDFGEDAQKVIPEIVWKQNTTDTHGTWKVQIASNLAARTDIGSSFTLGGATSQTITETAANTTPFRYLIIAGVSGTASASPWIQEIEFKIAGTFLDGVHTLPDDGDTRFYVRKTSTGTEWISIEIERDFPGLYTTGLLAAYDFTQVHGTTVYDFSGNGHDISLTLPTDPNYVRTGQGLKLASGLIQTPTITGFRTIVVLRRVGRGETAGFSISYGSGGGNGIIGEAFPTAAGNYGWVGDGLSADPHPIFYAASGGGNAKVLNRGGWIVEYFEIPSVSTSAIGLGGRATTTSSRCAEYEGSVLFAYSGQLDSTARRQVQDALRVAASARGINLHWEDCPTYAVVAGLIGESTADGRGLISGLTAGDQAAEFRRIYIQPGNATTNYAAPDRFKLGENQQTTTPATYCGPEIGFATSRKTAAASATRDLYIFKFAKGSTYACPSGAIAVGNPAVTSSWNAAEGKGTGLTWQALNHLYDMDQRMRLQGVGLRLIGIQKLLSLNDKSNDLCAPDTATYQGYHQGIVDAFDTYTGIAGLKWHIVKQHSLDPSADASAAIVVDAGLAALVAANSTRMTLYDASALALEADGVHYTGPASKTIGAAGYTYFGL